MLSLPPLAIFLASIPRPKALPGPPGSLECKRMQETAPAGVTGCILARSRDAKWKFRLYCLFVYSSGYFSTGRPRKMAPSRMQIAGDEDRFHRMVSVLYT